ncbi:MAG TPA: hypothetical protein VK869_15180 [Rubrobacteraceae bacterium]|nr:hypothetical protein [Rubrobacteraceae bacterium]
MEEKFTGLTLEELEAQQGELLPPKVEMFAFSIGQLNVNQTTQVAVAANVLSGGGDANAANYNATLQGNSVKF